MELSFLKIYRTLLCCALVLCFYSCSKDDVKPSETLTITEEILQLVNEHRASIGKNVLSFNALANDLAKEHTLYMIAQSNMSHENFDGRADRLYAEEDAIIVGENVAYGYKTAKAVMEGWLNSPGHRNNIEGEYFTHIGVAAIKNEAGTYYFTQIFLEKPKEQDGA